MKTIFFTIAICLLAIGTNFSKSKPNEMNTIVLVHGAWLDASCWNYVVPVLQKSGYKVITVNLPGHGKDNTTPEKLTMQSYVDAVKSAIGNEQNVILVGHSMGGMVISAAAEQIPGQIKKVVYVGAFQPASGNSLLELSQHDAEALLGPALVPSSDQLSLSVKKENFVNVFSADNTPELQKTLIENLKQEPAIPFTNPVTLTDANFGKLSKVVIYTTKDNAISYGFQKTMTGNLTNVTAKYELESSHTPFFSVPGELADIIIKEAK